MRQLEAAVVAAEAAVQALIDALRWEKERQEAAEAARWAAEEAERRRREAEEEEATRRQVNNLLTSISNLLTPLNDPLHTSNTSKQPIYSSCEISLRVGTSPLMKLRL